ncbi:hypothetical protein ABEB36_011363 [Hypothenemus hampei]|uniref:MADF domain-containing protein n=1 Tax=Hypothenemus hampei TaxID=57062 RepID=A0ABD1EI03_HYPHA
MQPYEIRIRSSDLQNKAYRDKNKVDKLWLEVAIEVKVSIVSSLRLKLSFSSVSCDHG